MKVLQAIKVLNERLKNIDNSVDSSELEALVKATAALKKLETTEDVLNISTAKVDEILGFAEDKSGELEAAKDANQAELLNSKNSALSSILSAQGKMSLAVAEKQNALNNIVDDFATMSDVPDGSTICTEIAANGNWKSFLKTGTSPFLFGILSRNDDHSTTGAGGFATTFSGPASANATHANGILNLLTGCHSYTTEYAGFYKPPTLCFLQGAAGNFIYRNLYTQYASTYTYAREAAGCIFIKNTTNAAITAILNFGGSGESTATYGGLGAMVGVPDLTNRTMSWTSISYTTGTSGTNLSGSFSVPANSTVVLLICTTSYYITSYETCYFKFLHWNVRLFRSTTLVEGLEIDLDLTKKAWQCSGHSNVLDIFAEE